jgi:hypothetical protein
MTDTKKLRLFSYKLTHDSEFAPNPFHDVLTLATCKPGMRRTKNLGIGSLGFHHCRYLKVHDVLVLISIGML